MKRLILIGSVLFLSLQSFAQVGDIFAALRSGNASALSRFFEDRIELGIESDYVMVNKKDATDKLSLFFRDHRPTNFKEIHQGHSRGRDAKFTIGELETSNGTFRVYIYVNQTGNTTSIQEIRFDRI